MTGNNTRILYCKIVQTNNEKYTKNAMKSMPAKDLASWHYTCFMTREAFVSIRTGLSEVNMADHVQKDWRELCVAVTNERDSTKLTALVRELVEALDRGKQTRHPGIRPPDAPPRIDKSGENDSGGDLNA